MARPERAFCRSRLWRRAAGHSVLRWALDGMTLSGAVLEVGCGAGDASVGLLEAFPAIDLTAVDVDPAMVTATTRQVAGRAIATTADATVLPYGGATFDAIVSLLMLHHVIEWERALAEFARVLVPGGVLVGYDLLDTAPARLIHRLDRSPFRLVKVDQFDDVIAQLPFINTQRSESWAGHLVKFRLQRK